MASSSSTGEGCSCGYCMQLLKDMSNPRELPCGHVCCLPCLRGDYSTGGTDTQCPQCRARFTKVCLDDLPQVPTQKEVLSPTQQSILCSYKDEMEAAYFCMHCNVELCTAHGQEHDVVMENRHKLVPIEKY